MKLDGGCHCGAVRFQAQVPDDVELLDCNCSICTKTGFLHFIIPHTDFELLTDAASLASYRFGSMTAEHLFCTTCGVKSFYQPRSHPECWSVNFHCLIEADRVQSRVVSFDGQNWDTAIGKIASHSRN